MRIGVSEAADQLAEMAERAEAGDEVVIVRPGKPDIKLVPVPSRAEQRRALLEDIAKRSAGKATPGPDGARSQDFLYGDDGLPC
ncbi:MAG: type II toxin-antitoxin system prevent-host-death family antitoxin [Pseudomonadota bacterium]